MNRRHKKILVSSSLGLAAAAALLAVGCGKGAGESEPAGQDGAAAAFQLAGTPRAADTGAGHTNSQANPPAGHGILILPFSDGLDEYVAQFLAPSAAEAVDETDGDSKGPAGQQNLGGSNNQSGIGAEVPGVPAAGSGPETAADPDTAGDGDSSDPNGQSEPGGNADGDNAPGENDGEPGTPEVIIPNLTPARDRFDIPWPNGPVSDKHPWIDLCEVRGCEDVVEAPEPNAKPQATADTGDPKPTIWIKLWPIIQ